MGLLFGMYKDFVSESHVNVAQRDADNHHAYMLCNVMYLYVFV